MGQTIVDSKFFYLHVEKESKLENGNISQYEILHEEIETAKDGWVILPFEIQVTDQRFNYAIEDADNEQSHGVVSLNVTRESLDNVMRAVRSINGYNNEMMFEIMFEVCDGEYVDIYDTIYF